MISRVDMFFFFFFQAEDGIRDYKVTGVQTCALPICSFPQVGRGDLGKGAVPRHQGLSRLYLRRISRNRSCGRAYTDRKSTRLNSSHLVISYAVFCLKKNKSYPLWRLFRMELI